MAPSRWCRQVASGWKGGRPTLWLPRWQQQRGAISASLQASPWPGSAFPEVGTYEVAPSWRSLRAALRTPTVCWGTVCRHPGSNLFVVAGAWWKKSLSWVLVAQSCLTHCDPMDCSPPGILQARILEWIAFPSPGDLPDSGTKPRSPALQADSLPSEPLGRPPRGMVVVKIFYQLCS